MKNNIVVLDGGGVAYDITWPDFTTIGTYTLYDQTKPEEVNERIKNASIVLTNKVPLTAQNINNAPNLRYIGCIATGYNHVDIAEAKKHGIVVTNVPDYSTNAVSQLVFAFIMEFTNHAVEHANAVQQGEWANSKYFCFWKQPVIELAGKTMGIIGFGNIGRKVGQIASAFGMHVMAYSPRPKPAPAYAPFEFASIEDVFKKSDFISLHCPLTAENTGMVNANLLSKMKNSAYIINTARGPLINENDLINAVQSGQIAGAALDVVSVEPMDKNSPLCGVKNIMVTPHYAWASVEARTKLMQEVFNNTAAFLAGNSANVVNP
ncbi:D-2-hydroxyacid dehydrogenase [Desulfovibrio sp. OttesenSCG-928-F07]|nr:D-2-hydroxyacid dehydrogenase [Desulfovibrio sp. OttesenSCG-928-F07]